MNMGRKERLRDELNEAGVIDPFAEYEQALLPQLVEELEYALFPAIHEGRTPTYGCIISPDAPKRTSGSIDTAKTPIQASREMANGVTSFAIRHEDKIPILYCFESSQDEELQLIKMRQNLGGLLVHRSNDETVRLFKDRIVFSWRKGSWSQRATSEAVATKVFDLVPQCDPEILGRILQFAVHSLSPVRVGATLIWWFQRQPPDTKDESIDLSHVILKAALSQQYGALRSLLSQHDGATILAPDSTLKAIGTHLKYSTQASELIPSFGGTRHTSAKRYTFDNPDVIAIVVSEDGPVSVFSDGAKIAELHEESSGSTERLLSKLVPEKAVDIVTDVFDKECKKCGKTVSVEVVTVYGFREKEGASCPACGNTIHEANCHLIFTRMRKRI